MSPCSWPFPLIVQEPNAMGTVLSGSISTSLPATPPPAASPEEMKQTGLAIGYALGVGSCIAREE
jgi:hypothetical protein